MPDVFIWYHADAALEASLLQWLHEVEDKAGIRGRLYIRKQESGATFMEAYADVSGATINRIENLAEKQPVFEHITRRCESFIDISR